MRRRFLVALTIAVSLAAVARAADTDEQLLVDNTAGGVAFTAAKIDPPGLPQASVASCRLEGAEIRYTYTGTTPTTSVGTLLEIGDTLVLPGHDRLIRFRAIRTGAVSGQLDCNYLR